MASLDSLFEPVKSEREGGAVHGLMVSALVPEVSGLGSSPGVRFLKLPVITGPLSCFVFHSRGSFKGFEIIR